MYLFFFTKQKRTTGWNDRQSVGHPAAAIQISPAAEVGRSATAERLSRRRDVHGRGRFQVGRLHDPVATCVFSAAARQRHGELHPQEALSVRHAAQHWLARRLQARCSTIGERLRYVIFWALSDGVSLYCYVVHQPENERRCL